MPRSLEFTTEISDAVCDRLATGESLSSICRCKDMPAKNTVLKWLARIPAFATQYALARAQGVEGLFEDLLVIADNPSIDPAHKRIMIDTRKWALSKLAPKKYGDLLQVETSVDVRLREMSDEALNQKIVELSKELGLVPADVFVAPLRISKE